MLKGGSTSATSKPVYVIFVMGPSASGKTYGIKTSLIPLLKKNIPNLRSVNTVYTIDGGDMRYTRCFIKKKLTKIVTQRGVRRN
jgi:hypothetical protein